MSKTVEEIARDTGFSITTVRFVINGQSERYRISAVTKKQIEDYIAIHGYSLNHAARSLKLKRSDTIGLVVPDLANTFFSRFIAALEIYCRKRNLLLLTVSSHEDPELENRAITNLLARGVDGLVVAPCQLATLPQMLRNKARTAIVMFDRNYAPSVFPTVVTDNFQGALLMTQGMLEEAGEACHFLCGDTKLPSIHDRIRGFLAASERFGVADGARRILCEDESSADAGRKMMRELIGTLQGPPRSFMCSSVLVLEGALQELKAQFGVIDKDILIGTFDDHTMLDLLPNRVLSIRQNESAIAKRVFERLIEPVASGPSANSIDVVPGDLIRRNFR